MPSTGLPAPRVVDDRAGQAALMQPGQVGNGGLGARKHDQVGVGQLGGVGDPAHQHAWFAGQRFDIGGVGDPRQPHRRYPQPLVAARRHRRADDAVRNHRQRILGVQPELVPMYGSTP